MAPGETPSGDAALRDALTRLEAQVAELRLRAEHAERLAVLGRFVAGLVHELNNPLTAVTMLSDVLLEKLEVEGHDPADLEKLRGIQEGGRRIQRLARGLLGYARPALTTGPVVLAEVVEEAVALARPALKSSGVALEQALSPVAPLHGSRAGLVQVAVALLRNAAEATGPGKRIALALAADAEEATLTVEDDGEGMTPEVAGRAFEPFFGTRGGLGLGLPNAREIVERHGGTLALRSAPGAGTTATVRLPLRGP